MPTDSKILGFTNRWYKPGIAESIILDFMKVKIKVFSPAFLIASKLEAFKGRGKNSFLTSSDIEDIITIIDGRSSIAKDILKSPPEVKEYLKAEFALLTRNKNFLDSIEAHISDRTNLEGRKKIILSRIYEFTEH